MSDLKLRGIKRRFGAFEALKGIDLDIAHGEFVVFVGPSGCGKSTLLRIIAGLDQADAGDIQVEGNVFDEETADVAHAVLTHLTRLRTIGTAGESFPLILDDPFADVAPSTRLSLLELLARSAGPPQVILLTNQEDVASWARLEALTGEVALVEPQTEARHARADDLAV